MTKEEILTKAIERAIDNGWHEEEESEYFESHNDIIFDHDFAKAFFGEEMTFVKAYEGTDFNGLYLYSEGGEPAVIEAWQWQWHLSQMVLEKEPLQYLKKFL